MIKKLKLVLLCFIVLSVCACWCWRHDNRPCCTNHSSTPDIIEDDFDVDMEAEEPLKRI